MSLRSIILKSDFVLVTPWYASYNALFMISYQPSVRTQGDKQICWQTMANLITAQTSHASMPQHIRQTILPALSSKSLVDTPLRIITINENWCGKSDPSQRRCIQNRLNQRAFRERHRAERVRRNRDYRRDDTLSTLPEEKYETGDADSKGHGLHTSFDERRSGCDNVGRIQQCGPSLLPLFSTLRNCLNNRDSQTACITSTCSSNHQWDELSLVINCNFMRAVTENAQRLRLDLCFLRSSTISTTLCHASVVSVPQTLEPVELQYLLPHDPIIDTIPHARLRYNVLHCIVTGRLDAACFSTFLRRSGTVVNIQGEALRSGLVVWDLPQHLSSWELSEAFMKTWGFLLGGCEDFVAVTNVWRNRKGERALTLDLGPGDC
jgi:hypothetical protein